MARVNKAAGDAVALLKIKLFSVCLLFETGYNITQAGHKLILELRFNLHLILHPQPLECEGCKSVPLQLLSDKHRKGTCLLRTVVSLKGHQWSGGRIHMPKQRYQTYRLLNVL